MVTAMTFDTSWLAGEMNRAGLLSDNDHQDVIKVKTLLKGAVANGDYFFFKPA